MMRALITTLGLALLGAGPALAYDEIGPYGGLQGEALEAAREGADGDRYVDPDNDPSNIEPREEEQEAEVVPPPVPQYQNPGLLGDGEIVIEDGQVTKGLLETE